MNTIEFFVPGVPATAGSKKAFANPRNPSRPIVTDDVGHKGKAWRKLVQDYAAEKFDAAGGLLDVPIELHCRFVMPRPKKHFRTGKRSQELRDDAPAQHTTKPDGIKMARAIEDALTHVVWKDDALVSRLIIDKCYGDRPGAHITIRWAAANVFKAAPPTASQPARESA